MKKMMFFMSALVVLTTVFSCSKDALDTLTDSETTAVEQLNANDTELASTFVELEAYARGGGDEKGGDFDKKGKKKKEIALDSLSQTIKDYIATNYAGATPHKAFADKGGNVVVFITKADGTKVALLFDSEGKFIKEIGKKPHGNNGGGPKDSSNVVAVKDLLPAITTYLSANYAGFTVLNAHKEKDGGFHVIIKTADGKTVKLVFDKAGKFVKVAVKGGIIVDISTLSTAITDYVVANYAGATITKAAQVKDGSYEISITTTAGKNIKLLFDKDGKFVKVK